MKMTPSLLAVAALTLIGCGDTTGLTNAQSGSYSIALGGTLAITLQTVGPGEYSSPPEISGASVLFTGVAEVGPAVPAGPTQAFSFVGVKRGRAIVTFGHTGANIAVVDTIDVH
ncbi:MAG: hypothetical protein ABJD11_00800 [Gemmatimonadota bacterium]